MPSSSATHSFAPQNEGRPPTVPNELNRIFRSERYQIQQPFFQIRKEGYNIQSEDGTEVYTAVRHRRLLRNFVARVCGFGGLIAGGLLSGLLLFSIFHSLHISPKSSLAIILPFVMSLAALGVAFISYIFVSKLVAPIRQAMVVDATGNPVMNIVPTSSIFIFTHEFMIQDKTGLPMARFKKTIWDSLFRTRWHCHSPEGQYLFSAWEESLFLGLLRRYVRFMSFIPMDFIFAKGSGKPFGRFIRRYSIRDKYQLDYTADATEGWIMVAAAILLDTGEHR